VGLVVDHHLLDKRESDPKRRAAVIAISCRYKPVVRLDNGVRAMDSPMPMPSALLVNGSKTAFNLSSGMPGPPSDTDSSANCASLPSVRSASPHFTKWERLI
jgi:hypothetical protein